MYALEIQLTDIKPVSINKAYYKNKQLTKESRSFRLKFLSQLLPYQEQLKLFKDTFDPKSNLIKLYITVEVPHKAFFLKGNIENGISNVAGDAANYEKLITDFLTNPKYCTDKYLSQDMVNVGIDDRYIKLLEIAQIPSLDDKWNIRVALQILGLKNEFNYIL